MPDRLPRSVRDLFGSIEPAAPSDLAAVERQIGRRPRGGVLVARRCSRGVPSVIMTSPLEPTGGPVPPLLWLTCPNAAARVGELESRGLNSEFSARLSTLPDAAALLAGQEKRLAACASELARTSGCSLASELSSRGVAGGRPGAVKCLHAHLAFRLAAGEGVVGDWCLERLGAESWECDDTANQACFR